jgi:hypothetical protein
MVAVVRKLGIEKADFREGAYLDLLPGGAV